MKPKWSTSIHHEIVKLVVKTLKNTVYPIKHSLSNKKIVKNLKLVALNFKLKQPSKLSFKPCRFLKRNPN
jgi:hypothetical protein